MGELLWKAKKEKDVSKTAATKNLCHAPRYENTRRYFTQLFPSARAPTLQEMSAHSTNMFKFKRNDHETGSELAELLARENKWGSSRKKPSLVSLGHLPDVFLNPRNLHTCVQGTRNNWRKIN